MKLYFSYTKLNIFLTYFLLEHCFFAHFAIRKLKKNPPHLSGQHSPFFYNSVFHNTVQYFDFTYNLTLKFELNLYEPYIWPWHGNMCRCSRVRIRVAAKIFVFVMSRKFREIFNFVFREIYLEFRKISRNTKSKFGGKFRIFAKHEIKMWATFWPFCRKKVIFLI